MDEYKLLNPKSKPAMYVGYAVSYVIYLIIACGIYWVVDSNYPENLESIIYVLMIISILVLIYILIAPPVYYRHYRYMITSEKIDIRRGILVLRRILVPIERIHQVEITRGPINNAFGLADIEITTAGGTVVLEYLDRQEAEHIADALNDFVRSMIKDRGSSADDQ